jgi:CHAD domain-containing protein
MDMNGRNPFGMFIGQRTNSLLDRVDKVGHTLSDEHIRRVRVGIKRWRTLYELVRILMPNHFPSNNVEQSIRRLFKRAGTVRNCQLNRQLVTGLDLPEKLEKKVQHSLKKQEKKRRKQLKKAIKAFHPKRVRTINRRIEQLAPIINPEQVSRQLRHFMDHEVLAIEALQRSDASPEQLHRIRKHLKSLIEVGNVIRSITPDKSLTRLVQRAKTRQRQLGTWHDQVSLIGQIKDYIVDHPTGLSPEQLRSLFDRLDAVVNRQTERIRHEVAKLSQVLPLLTPWRIPTQRS